MVWHPSFGLSKYLVGLSHFPMQRISSVRANSITVLLPVPGDTLLYCRYRVSSRPRVFSRPSTMKWQLLRTLNLSRLCCREASAVQSVQVTRTSDTRINVFPSLKFTGSSAIFPEVQFIRVTYVGQNENDRMGIYRSFYFPRRKLTLSVLEVSSTFLLYMPHRPRKMLLAGCL
jgi:hypothetical protein